SFEVCTSVSKVKCMMLQLLPDAKSPSISISRMGDSLHLSIHLNPDRYHDKPFFQNLSIIKAPTYHLYPLSPFPNLFKQKEPRKADGPGGFSGIRQTDHQLDGGAAFRIMNRIVDLIQFIETNQPIKGKFPRRRRSRRWPYPILP